MLTKNKKNFRRITVTIFLMIFLAVIFFIKQNALAVSINLNINAGLGTANIFVTITSIIQIFIGLLGIIALGLVLYGGFLWMTSAGNEEKISRAKKILTNAVIGLIIILSAFAIVSFILNKLVEATTQGPSGPPGQGGLPPGGAIGGGIIESVYPLPGSQNNPRNTLIMVTFKEGVTNIIDPTNHPGGNECQGFTPGVDCGFIAQTNNEPNVKIINNSNSGNYQGTFLPANQVIVKSNNNSKNYTFDPLQDLGSAAEPTNYTVTLTSNLNKISNGQPALPSGFDWSFGVGTYLDNTPPQVTIVFPTAGTTVPKNAMVQINFTEAISPISATGIVEVDPTTKALLPGTFQNITIGYDNNTKFVPGTFSIGNQYKTVEFLSDSPCDQGDTGLIINSCGEQVYCLPGNEDFIATTTAADLNTLLNGIYDAAGNSLDGGGENGQNKNGVSNGPPDDNYWWEFSTNDQLDLTPPVLNSVVPAGQATNIPLNIDILANFSEALSASSVNTTNYIILLNDDNCTDPQIAQPDQYGQYPNMPADCWPGGFGVGLDNTGQQAQLNIYTNLESLTWYNPRLLSYIKDLYQNCFYPSSGP